MKYKHCFNCGCKYHPARSNQLFCSDSCRIKYNKKSYLILPIKKKWFDMIREGIKTEEYREIKPYYKTRFQNAGLLDTYGLPTLMQKWILFRNGYSKDSPSFQALCSIDIKQGRTEWGAEEGKEYYVLTIIKI